MERVFALGFIFYFGYHTFSLVWKCCHRSMVKQARSLDKTIPKEADFANHLQHTIYDDYPFYNDVPHTSGQIWRWTCHQS